MWAMAIPAAISAGTAIYNAINNRNQQEKANKQLQSTIQNRPSYTTPGYINSILDIANRQSGGNMPGYAQAQDKIAANTALGAGEVNRTALDPNQTLGALTKLYTNQTANQNNLAVQNANYQNNQLNNLKSAYQLGADYADKGWDWNTKQAFEEQYNRLAADRAAYNQAANQSTQGLMTGLSNFGSSLMDAYSRNPNAFKDWFGTSSAGNSTGSFINPALTSAYINNTPKKIKY